MKPILLKDPLIGSKIVRFRLHLMDTYVLTLLHRSIA